MRGSLVAVQSLPPEIAHRAVATAANKLRGLNDGRDGAWRDVQQLEEQRERAVAADRQAFAKALANGKQDPGTATLDAHDAAAAAARRKAEALDLAVETAAKALGDAIALHGAEWAATVEAELDDAVDAYAALVEQVITARTRVDHLRGVLSFIRQPQGRGYSPAGGRLLTLVGQNGEPFRTVVVLDALRADATPPPREPDPAAA